MAKEPAITVLPAFLSQLASKGNRFHDLSIRMCVQGFCTMA